MTGGLLRATVVTRGWNGYRNKSQHRKLTPETKILPSLLQGFEPATFRSRVGDLTTELSPLPRLYLNEAQYNGLLYGSQTVRYVGYTKAKRYDTEVTPERSTV